MVRRIAGPDKSEQVANAILTGYHVAKWFGVIAIMVFAVGVFVTVFQWMVRP